MQHSRRRAALGLIAAIALGASLPAAASDRAVVEAFYTDYLSVGGPKDKAGVAGKIISESWKSFGDYSGKFNTRDGLTKMLGGFHQLMPDLNWKIEEIIQSGNRYVVRGRATGTPKGPFMGVDGGGKGFTIMSIDIHEVRDGKIVESYHIEDWAGALRQLSGK